jgi:hypothetical protein
MEDLEDFDVSPYGLPVFFPTACMPDSEVAARMAAVRREIGPVPDPRYPP